MEQLMTTAVKCANKMMAKRNERIEMTDDCGWINLDIFRKDRTGGVSFRKDNLKICVFLWHIHYYVTGYYPFNYYQQNGRESEISRLL